MSSYSQTNRLQIELNSARGKLEKIKAQNLKAIEAIQAVAEAVQSLTIQNQEMNQRAQSLESDVIGQKKISKN